MKMTHKISALLLSSTLAACGGGGGGGSDPAPAAQGTNGVGVTGSDATSGQNGTGTGTGTVSDGSASGGTSTGTAAIDCGAAWTAYVKANPTGLNYAYKSVNQTLDSSDKVTSTVTLTIDNRIVRADDSIVVTATTTSISGLPGSQKQEDVKKADFLANCGKFSGVQVGDLQGANAKVLEQSAQSLKVAAGTFSTNYTKVLVTQTGTQGETTLSSWVLADGSSLLVKSDAWTNTVVDGKPFKNHNVTELTKLVRP